MAAAHEFHEMPAAFGAQDIPVPDEQDSWDDQDPWSQAAPGLMAADDGGGAVGAGASTWLLQQASGEGTWAAACNRWFVVFWEFQVIGPGFLGGGVPPHRAGVFSGGLRGTGPLPSGAFEGPATEHLPQQSWSSSPSCWALCWTFDLLRDFLHSASSTDHGGGDEPADETGPGARRSGGGS